MFGESSSHPAGTPHCEGTATTGGRRDADQSLGVDNSCDASGGSATPRQQGIDGRCHDLTDRIRELTASIHAAEAELSELVADLDEQQGWTGSGIRSLAHWLTLNCGFTVHEACARSEVARRRAELPCLWSAFESGVLSVGAVRSATRVATPETDSAITEVAVTATAPQAARAFAAWRAGLANEAAEAERAAERARKEGDHSATDGTSDGQRGSEQDAVKDPNRDAHFFFRTWWDEEHHLRVDGCLDPETGALFDAMLDKAFDDLHADTPPPVPDPARAEAHSDRDSGTARARPHHAPRHIDALAELIRLAGENLAGNGAVTPWVERFAVTVTIDAEVLAGVRRGNGVLADGTPIDTATVRRSLPDSSLEGLVLGKGRPLWLGRSARLATRGQRRALLARDRGCAFPGCSRSKGLRAHHVVEWVKGGATDVTNMVLLCHRHHTLLHQGEYDIRMADGLPVVESRAVRDMHARTKRRSAPPSTDPPRPLGHWSDRRGGPAPRPGACRRSGEPLTHYGLDVIVNHLFGVVRQSATAAAA